MITLIAAIGENRELGKDNEMLWHLPDDFKRFKRVTTGHAIIMGRKTFESLGKKVLPKRVNVVITRDRTYDGGCAIVVDSLKKALRVIHDPNPFIIGGGEIYKQALKLADRLDLTIVHNTFEADVFFPSFDEVHWKEVSREFHPKDERHQYDFSFVTYKRISNIK